MRLKTLKYISLLLSYLSPCLLLNPLKLRHGRLTLRYEAFAMSPCHMLKTLIFRLGRWFLHRKQHMLTHILTHVWYNLAMKEVRDFYNQFDSCRAYDIPLCADACPFRMDILDIQERIAKKRFNAAYKSIRDCVAFPEIVANVCPAYCEGACVRAQIDEAVQIKKIEQSCISLATRKDPNAYNLPSRDTNVAVIGGGISGMAFALKMASRKCNVTVFERSPQIGGRLAEVMDEADYLADFELQFKHEEYTLRLNTEASVDAGTGVVTVHKAAGDSSGDEALHFDVVYIATGAGGESFGVNDCVKAGSTGIFAGGSLCGKDLMHALADGINIAACADGFAKTGNLDYPAAPAASKCVANEDKLVRTPAVVSGDANYNEDECVAEAERCIRCQCDACEAYCDLIDYYEKWPVKMRDEIFLSVKPAGSLVHKCPSRKYIAACTECRIINDVCPENIDLCGMIKSARHQMHAVDKMPAAYRQYYLRDMEFANGEYAAVVKAAPAGGAHYAFFPGCNLGALDPDYVIKPYKWLCDNYPGTGLLLKCCSVPVDWAGNGEAHEAALAQLKADWESLGRPVLITACMSCDKHLHEYLPEIETATIYELMSQRADSFSVRNSAGTDVSGRSYTIFDPCSARGNENVQTAIRRLASDAGINADELSKGDMHGCCGFGGQGAIAQPKFAQYIADKRIAAAKHPYLVYCSNCRDVFTSNGMPAIHIFDLLFDVNADNANPSPGITERRVNRVILKDRLLKEFWGEEMNAKPDELKYKLTMNEEVAAKVEKLHILADDIVNVIEHAERTGRRTRNTENGHYRAYNEIGAITLWVEYSVPGGNDSGGDAVREIHNVYSHRMQIKLEAVFNGRKIDG